MFDELRAIDVYQAARRIKGAVRRTALRPSKGLSQAVGGEVLIKPEYEQPTGSFKLRGAFNVLAAMSPAERASGVVASSAGNHGLGVASAARHFGVSATIFVPAAAPTVKKSGIAALGAAVDDRSADYDVAMVSAKAYAAERGATFINPCLGRDLIAGQGTVGLEIVEERPDTATIVVPVGGAGLLGGIASFVRRVAPHIRIVGAQSVNTAAMSKSLGAGRVVGIASVPTLADGLAGQIDEEALDIGRRGLDAIVELTEEEIGEAIAWLARAEGARIEGAGAVGVAALLHRKVSPVAAPVVVVVSGGNIDPSVHDRIVASATAGTPVARTT